MGKNNVDVKSLNALVIGASGSLGAAIVFELESKGFEVYTTVRKLTKEMDAKKTFVLDVTDQDAVVKVVAQLPPISFVTSTVANDPLVNRFEKFSIDAYDADWQVNVRSQIFMLQQLLIAGKLIEDSSIMLVGSEVIINERLSFCAPYSISKYALLGVMKSLAVELASKKIRINMFSPGMMQTSFLKNIPSLVITQYLQKTRRVALLTPQEVAKEMILCDSKKETSQNYELL